MQNSFLQQKLLLGLSIITMVSLWTPSLWARGEPAPVVEGSGGGGDGSSIEARVSRLERLMNNQALVDMSTRLDSLQTEIQNMEGKLEEQQHAMEQLKKRQRDLYLDIDQRLSKLEKAGAGATSSQNQTMGAFVPAQTSTPIPAAAQAATGSAPDMTPSSVPPTAVATTTDTKSLGLQKGDASDEVQKQRIAYESAFNLLKDGRYEKAISALKHFVEANPKSNYADNAQYWLGEANYAQRNYKVALAEFKKVISKYPASPKCADAMLKMGYTFQNLGQIDQARQSLNNVAKNYPDSTAANLAQKRLQNMKLGQ